MRIRTDIRDNATPTLLAVIAGLTGGQAGEINAVGARYATEAGAEYHRDFQARDGWANKTLPTHGPGRESTGFGEQVAASWHFRDADATGATIANDGPMIRHKVKGGTIEAKRVKFLTIPLVPEAHGRRAATFAQDFGLKLTARNGGLWEPDRPGKEGRKVYAFVRRVTQGPWRGALPPDADLATAFVEGWRSEMDRRADA